VDGSNVLYELLMKPEASKFEEQTRIAEIEQRIERLEKALGSAPNKMVKYISYDNDFFFDHFQSKILFVSIEIFQL